MKILVMVKATASSETGQLPSSELMEAMMHYNQELVRHGILLAGEGLKPSSQGFRVRFSGSSRTVIEGPFAETKELVAGYWVWNVKSMEEALEWVKRCPNPMPEESEIELRPIYELEDFGDVVTPEVLETEGAMRAVEFGLAMPTFVQSPNRMLLGIAKRYTLVTRSEIPSQWNQFVEKISDIPHQAGPSSFGVSYECASDGSFDYFTGVEVTQVVDTSSRHDDPTPAFDRYCIPAGRYVVVEHTGHVSEIPKALETIWTRWIPSSGLKILRDGPCVEHYTEAFDPTTGMGGVEFWLPLEE